MSDEMRCFTKDNMDTYLRELAKEYRKLGGKNVPAEIILVGGAAILARYGFRGMTTDMDAVIHAASTIREAINRVRDKYGLPNGWLNADFTKTGSYTPAIEQYSVYYKTFGNVITVRFVAAEYLIAMKLRSGRKYKNDMSDVVGILAEHEKAGEPITLDKIDKAVRNLYGGWHGISGDSQKYIHDVIENGNYEQRYNEVAKEEIRAKELLIDFEQDYPGITSAENVESILKTLKDKLQS